jgi:hypothetical protein
MQMAGIRQVGHNRSDSCRSKKQKIMLDHFGSGISNNRTCKWGIE